VPAAAPEDWRRHPPADGVVRSLMLGTLAVLSRPAACSEPGSASYQVSRCPTFGSVPAVCATPVTSALGAPGPGLSERRPCWPWQDSVSASAWRRGASLPDRQEARQPHAMHQLCPRAGAPGRGRLRGGPAGGDRIAYQQHPGLMTIARRRGHGAVPAGARPGSARWVAGSHHRAGRGAGPAAGAARARRLADRPRPRGAEREGVSGGGWAPLSGS
jgi:hypothetical protein